MNFDASRAMRARAGGTRDISRWCNHRTGTRNTPQYPPRPERAREGHAGSGVQNHRRTFAPFSRHCRGASRIWGRWGGSFPVVPGRSATFTTG